MRAIVGVVENVKTRPGDAALQPCARLDERFGRGQAAAEGVTGELAPYYGRPRFQIDRSPAQRHDG